MTKNTPTVKIIENRTIVVANTPRLAVLAGRVNFAEMVDCVRIKNQKFLSKNKMMNKPIVKMENWSVVSFSDGYTPPELQHKYIRGIVYGHLRFEDGECVTCSQILKAEDGKIETLNTIYVLGDPCPEFVKWCKEADCHIPTKEKPFI